MSNDYIISYKDATAKITNLIKQIEDKYKRKLYFEFDTTANDSETESNSHRTAYYWLQVLMMWSYEVVHTDNIGKA